MMTARTHNTERIEVAARTGFEAVDEIHERFRGVDFPVEFALPWRYE